MYPQVCQAWLLQTEYKSIIKVDIDNVSAIIARGTSQNARSMTKFPIASVPAHVIS